MYLDGGGNISIGAPGLTYLDGGGKYEKVFNDDRAGN